MIRYRNLAICEEEVRDCVLDCEVWRNVQPVECECVFWEELTILLASGISIPCAHLARSFNIKQKPLGCHLKYEWEVIIYIYLLLKR
jgi:hypothetical protein